MCDSQLVLYLERNKSPNPIHNEEKSVKNEVGGEEEPIFLFFYSGLKMNRFDCDLFLATSLYTSTNLNMETPGEILPVSLPLRSLYLLFVVPYILREFSGTLVEMNEQQMSRSSAHEGFYAA